MEVIIDWEKVMSLLKKEEETSKYVHHLYKRGLGIDKVPICPDCFSLGQEIRF